MNPLVESALGSTLLDGRRSSAVRVGRLRLMKTRLKRNRCRAPLWIGNGARARPFCPKLFESLFVAHVMPEPDADEPATKIQFCIPGCVFVNRQLRRRKMLAASEPQQRHSVASKSARVLSRAATGVSIAPG